MWARRGFSRVAVAPASSAAYMRFVKKSAASASSSQRDPTGSGCAGRPGATRFAVGYGCLALASPLLATELSSPWR
eukprot:11676657-Heterocapsa_arctica.AAC.1